MVLLCKYIRYWRTKRGRMFFGRIVAMVTVWLCLGANAYAGAWLQPEDKGLFITQATYFTTDQFYDYNGKLRHQSRYSKYEVQPYVEYGLLPNLTIGGTGFLQSDHQGGNENKGLADPSIFARTRLWHDDKQVVSIQPLVKFESAFEHAGSPRGGSGSTDIELSLLYGRSMNILSNRDYLDINMGYRYRSGFLNDQFHADAALGLSLSDRWQIVPAARAIVATKVPSSVAFSQNGDQDYALYKVEVGAFYKVSDTQTVGATIFDLVAGQQVGSGSGITISFGQAF